MKAIFIIYFLLGSYPLFAKGDLVNILGRGLAAKFFQEAPHYNCASIDRLEKEVALWSRHNPGQGKLSANELNHFNKAKYPYMGELIKNYQNISKEVIKKKFQSSFMESLEEAKWLQYLGRISSPLWRVEDLNKLLLEDSFCSELSENCDQTVEAGALTLDSCLKNIETIAILKSKGVVEEYSLSMMGTIVDFYKRPSNERSGSPEGYKKDCRKIKSFIKSFAQDDIENKLRYCQRHTSNTHKAVYRKLCGGMYPYLCKIKNFRK